MLVGVCDFPSAYAFPPTGYGGIERWLWAVAVGARQAGADVHLLGPQWRADLGDWPLWSVRLEDLTPVSAELNRLRFNRYDMLVVGHEYPSLPAWHQAWRDLDCDVVTFQHSAHFEHRQNTFDGIRSRLYCYSPEMARRYDAHRPILELAVHRGLLEEEIRPTPGRDLLWLGRIDSEKAPHLASMAAKLLHKRLRIVGPIFDESYVSKYSDWLTADHVDLVGELAGDAKAAALGESSTFVYTCSRDYVEAGAAVFGEALRAGAPVAALTWRQGTCAEAALCSDTGRVAVAVPRMSDAEAAALLAVTIEEALDLNHAAVQEIGMERFDPGRHFRALAARSC